MGEPATMLRANRRRVYVCLRLQWHFCALVQVKNRLSWAGRVRPDEPARDAEGERRLLRPWAKATGPLNSGSEPTAPSSVDRDPATIKRHNLPIERTVISPASPGLLSGRMEAWTRSTLPS